MRLLLVLFIIFSSGPLWSQSADKYVRKIEKLRFQGKLTIRQSKDKTFVGSVTGYYKDSSLVLISTLTDAEAAGTEKLYFIKNGKLYNVFIMAATFDSNDEWITYFNHHKSVENCYDCHNKPNCTRTEITFRKHSRIIENMNGIRKELTGDRKEELLENELTTFEELKVLLKTLA